MDPITILAALGPLIVDGGKAIIQKYFAPAEFKPTNIDDYTKMRQIDIDLYKSVNDAGGDNPTYLWVEAIIRLMRPTVALTVLLVWAGAHLDSGITDTVSIDNFAGAIGFYLFGDRTLFYAKKAVTK